MISFDRMIIRVCNWVNGIPTLLSLMLEDLADAEL